MSRKIITFILKASDENEIARAIEDKSVLMIGDKEKSGGS